MAIRSRKHAARYVAALSVAGLVAAPLAHADTLPTTDPTDPDKKETVTIHGHKETYKTDTSDSLKATAALIDTPQTVQVITDDLMREQGATTLTDALKNSPGVGTFFLGENGSTNTGDAIYMRGSDASGSIFVDGVRDVASISRDVFNIEQIEVLKGAAGSDVGRAAATGAVNMYTKHAKLANFSNGSAAIGDADYGRVTVDSNWRLGKTMALRLNLMDQDAGVPGRDVIRNKRWGVAGSVGFGLGTTTRVFLDVMHVEQNNIPDGGASTVGLPGYTTPNPGTRDFLTTAARPNSRNFYGTNDDHDHIVSSVLTETVEHDFSDGIRLNNITRWSQTHQNYQLMSFTASPTTLLTPNVSDPSTWTISRSVNNKDATNKMLTNQTNLQLKLQTGPVEHSISTGVELIREEQVAWTFVGTGAYPAVSLYNPNRNVTGYSRALSGAYTDGVSTTEAIYAGDTAKFGDAWLVNAGLRLDHYDTDYKSVAATSVVTPLKASDDLLSGKLGVIYKPASNGSVYVSYAVSQQPPGGANFTLSATNTANANNPDVEPQVAKTYEAGTKWDLLGKRLSVSGAVYSTKYSDTIAQDTDGTYYRTGEKSVSGIEVGVVGQLTKAWSISTGYTLMNSKVKNQALVTADGSPNLTYNPSDAFTLWTTYKIGRRLTVGGGANYNGKMKRGTDGAVGTPAFVKAYTVFNGLIEYNLTKRVNLQFNAYNLFDTRYVAAINKSGYRYTPGAPQNFRLTANVKF